MRAPARPAESPRARLRPTPLTPLIDVVLLLVLFFALSQGVAERTRRPVRLPEAASAQGRTDRAAETTVTVDASGRLWLDGRPVSLAALGDALAARGPGRPVRLRGDGRLAYGRVRAVLDALAARGVRELRLAVQPARGAAARRSAP